MCTQGTVRVVPTFKIFSYSFACAFWAFSVAPMYSSRYPTACFHARKRSSRRADVYLMSAMSLSNIEQAWSIIEPPHLSNVRLSHGIAGRARVGTLADGHLRRSCGFLWCHVYWLLLAQGLGQRSNGKTHDVRNLQNIRVLLRRWENVGSRGHRPAIFMRGGTELSSSLVNAPVRTLTLSANGKSSGQAEVG